MTQNVIWNSHGTQTSPEKKYYYFPFKSLSFYAPQGHILSMIVGIDALKNVCKNLGTHMWVKEPTFDVVDDNYDYNLILSNERYTQIWNFIEDEMNENENFEKNIKKNNINQDTIKVMSNDDIETYIFKMFSKDNKENLNRLKELWLRNKREHPLIELRPMILELLEDEEGGLYLCEGKLNPRAEKIIENDEIKVYNNNDINISLENAFQLIEDKLERQGKNPRDFNISMIVCRVDHGKQMSKRFYFNVGENSKVYTKKTIRPTSKSPSKSTSYLKLKLKSKSALHLASDSASASDSDSASTKSEDLAGHIKTRKNINVVPLSENQLEKYLFDGSLPQKKRINQKEKERIRIRIKIRIRLKEKGFKYYIIYYI